MKNVSVLSVPLFGQETNMWCWAASCQMAMNYLGYDIEQCTEANDLFGYTDCCISPTPNQCVRGGSPQFEKYNFSTDRTNVGTALSFEDLETQISNNTPVTFSWKWLVKGGHVMVVVGTGTDANGGQWILINNPMPVNIGKQEWITYSDFVQGDNHTHGKDIYNITNNNANPTAMEKTMEKPNLEPIFEAARKIINTMNGFGVLTASETAVAKLNESDLLRENAIVIKRINPKVYDENLDEKSAIIDQSEVLVPLKTTTDQEAVWLKQVKSGWELQRICDPKITKEILAEVHQPILKGKNCFLLEVPEKDRILIGYYEGNKLKLIPLFQQNKSITLEDLLNDPFTSGWDENV